MKKIYQAILQDTSIYVDNLLTTKILEGANLIQSIIFFSYLFRNPHGGEIQKTIQRNREKILKFKALKVVGFYKVYE